MSVCRMSHTSRGQITEVPRIDAYDAGLSLHVRICQPHGIEVKFRKVELEAEGIAGAS